MKPITALLLLSLAGVGAACSDPVTKADTAATQAPLETAEIQGTLNLNIGRANDAAGGLNIGAGSGSSSGGLIIGPAATGGNFEDLGDLGIDLEDTPDTLLEPQAPEAKSDEDELVRLPPNN